MPTARAWRGESGPCCMRTTHPAPSGAPWGEEDSLRVVCACSHPSQNHGADVGPALVGAAVAQSITPVGPGPGRGFVVAISSRLVCASSKDALPASALPRSRSFSARHDPVPCAEPVCGFTTHEALRSRNGGIRVPSKSVLLAPSTPSSQLLCCSQEIKLKQILWSELKSSIA